MVSIGWAEEELRPFKLCAKIKYAPSTWSCALIRVRAIDYRRQKNSSPLHRQEENTHSSTEKMRKVFPPSIILLPAAALWEICHTLRNKSAGKKDPMASAIQSTSGSLHAIRMKFYAIFLAKSGLVRFKNFAFFWFRRNLRRKKSTDSFNWHATKKTWNATKNTWK